MSARKPKRGKPSDAVAERVPLPFPDMLARMALDASAAPVDETLGRISIQPRVLEDFRPLQASLESELSRLQWEKTGLIPFVENVVPYAINNDGRLSENAAAVLYGACADAPAGEIRALELGAGTGLFARYLLDAFRALCESAGRDYYERLRLYVTDRSAVTVRHWEERGIFADHAAQVVTGVCDAVDPRRIQTRDGRTPELREFSAVFCNYVLDSLPASVIREGAGGCEEMCVRTHLSEDERRVSARTSLGLEELRRLAASTRVEDREQLLPLVPLFELEAAFQPCRELPPFAVEALAFASGVDRIALNHGALRCLERCLGALAPHGFVLVNDYGPVRVDQIAEQAIPQRFGPTTALGLNFPFLEHHLGKQGKRVSKPDQDDERPIHARLIANGAAPGATAAFRDAFSAARQRETEGPLDEARKQMEAGRHDRAMACYRTAVRRCPRDWRLLGEVAEFVIRQAADYPAGLELARAAIALNPWYSAWLWNVLGDALFALERFAPALEAYLQACRIDPTDPRTHLNLAYAHAQAARPREALAAIAAGLATDPQGAYRARLVEKQQQILGELDAEQASQREWLTRRAARLQSPGPYGASE